MSAADDYPFPAAVADGRVDGGAYGRIECSLALQEIDRLRAEVRTLRDIPPHPHFVSYVVAPRGAIVKTEHGWLMVLPTDPDTGREA